MSKVEMHRTVKTIALAMSELNIKLAFIGGAVVSLYNHTNWSWKRLSMDEARLEIACLSDMEKIRHGFIERGFTETKANKVICQFHYEGIPG